MEQLILSLPPALFGLAAMTFLFFLVFKTGNDGLSRSILAVVSIISAYAAAFAYFYSVDGEVFTGGFTANRAGLLIFTALCFLVLFSVRNRKFSHYYFTAVSAAMFVTALSIYSYSLPAMAAGFFAVDLFTFITKQKETEAQTGAREKAVADKTLYFILAAAFMMLFISAPAGIKIQKLAFNGMLVMLILSAASVFFTSTKHELFKTKQPFMAPAAVMGFIPVLAQFAVILAIIGQNRGLLLGSYMPLVILALLLPAAFKAVTEEKYASFALRDIYILFYLGVFGAVSSVLNPFVTGAYAAFMVLSAALSVEASAEPQSARLTMAGVKYSFDKIPDNWNIFFSMLLSFAAEMLMIVSICMHISGGPMLRAAALIGAALYSPALLNKFFTILSMAIRIKVDLKGGKLLNIGRVIMILFCGMAAVMLYKW